MRTKSLLQNATKSTATAAIETARTMGWNDDAIARHGSAAVKALVTPVTTARVKQASAKPAGAKAAKPRKAPTYTAIEGGFKYPVGRDWIVQVTMPDGSTGPALLSVVKHGARGGHLTRLASAITKQTYDNAMSAEKLDRLAAGEQVGFYLAGLGRVLIQAQ